MRSSFQICGIISLIGENTYIDEHRLDLGSLLKKAGMEGRFCTVLIVEPGDDPRDMDEHILPLVESIQYLGYRTLASCEGHIDDPVYGVPHVAYYSEIEPIEVASKIASWEWEQVPQDKNIWRIQPKYQDLQRAWKDIPEIAERLKSV